MDNTKFLKIVIIVLLFINIATLWFMWRTNNHHGGQPPQGREDAGGFLTHELMLNDAQQKQFSQLKEEHHAAAEELQEDARELHHQYFELLHAPSADSVIVLKFAEAIAANQKQMELITFYHFQKIRAICTPEQQKKFDEVIGEALRMMAPKPQGHPPGR